VTADVIDLKAHRPHKTGNAICLDCRREWAVVVAVEDDNNEFECPKCKTFKGVWAGRVIPRSDELRLECDCGNDLFYVLSDSTALCPSCGDRMTLD